MRNKPIPKEILTTPSPLINRLTDYINHTSIEYIHQFSLHSALTFLSHLYGRQYISEWGTPINLSSLLVSKSGVGKNYCRKAIGRFTMLNQNIIGGATGDSGLFTALVLNPNAFMITDEIGAKMNSKRPEIKAFWVFIRDLYNTEIAIENAYAKRISGVIQEKSSNENYTILNPSLSILGMTTPGLLTSNLTDEDVESGNLNRFCIINAHADEVTRNSSPMESNPEGDLESGIIASGSELVVENGQKSYSSKPELKTIGFESGLSNYLLDLKHELRMKKNSDYTVRLVENAIRIAMIITVSLKNKTISKEIMDWSLEYVKYWLYNVKHISESAGKTDYSKVVDKIINKIKTRDEEGIERWKLNAYILRLGWTPTQRELLLNDLLSDKIIELSDGIMNPKNGKRKKTYYYIGEKRK